nr:unnamed protein product [Callosobruchus analis]
MDQVENYLRKIDNIQDGAAAAWRGNSGRGMPGRDENRSTGGQPDQRRRFSRAQGDEQDYRWDSRVSNENVYLINQYIENSGQLLSGPETTSMASLIRCLNVVLGDNDYALAYVDDLVVFSASTQDHIEHLRSIFE